jgi:choice-of-anchor C domain-containing protein
MRSARLRGIAAVTVAGMAVVLGTPANAGPINLITNGSFEFGLPAGPSPGNWVMLDAGATNITGWTVTQNNIDWGNAFWQAADGTHSLDLNGNMGLGGISQTINTTIGTRYRLTFSLAGNPNLGEERAFPGDYVVSLTAFAGTATADFDFTVLTTHNLTNMGWTEKSLIFTAQSSTTPIRFVSTTDFPIFGDQNLAHGPAVDNVSVTKVVPEPSTIALFGFGLLGLARMRARRLRRA